MSSALQVDFTPTTSTLLATASAYLEVYTTLDAEAYAALLSDGFMLEMAPAFARLPTLDRDACISRSSAMKDVMSTFPVTIIRSWPNPSLRQVFVWAKSEAHFHEHLRDGDIEQWELKGEYMFLMTMDASGRRVEQVLEFVDSKATADITAMVFRALEKKETLV
ncbi:unnamed protein product [Fusarium equiseti]|uniref:SnoaL-like domain-containing protein n=1 Tax=Fusarium equiseti TaxID=61235 RepID=A0A8J2N8F8_FUSEQ|nr:unnamed protein product [Fusarium equiseti]